MVSERRKEYLHRASRLTRTMILNIGNVSQADVTLESLVVLARRMGVSDFHAQPRHKYKEVFCVD
jgi:hypothetical protein